LLKNRDNQFVINSENIEKANLLIDEKVLAHGGSKVDLKGLVNNKDQIIREKEHELEVLEKELQAQESEIYRQHISNDIQEEQNQLKSLELEDKKEEIEARKIVANKLLADAQKLKEVLFKNQEILHQQENELQSKQQILTASKNELQQKQQHIKERENQINEHEKRLNKQRSQIDTQGSVITGGIIFASVIAFLVVWVLISNISKKRKNRKLAQLNDEVDRQKEHIQLQSQQLIQINKELEKLSIVASQTDNGVTIMDADGNIEWLNHGFTNMYGYTFDDLKEQGRLDFTKYYLNDDILQIKQNCIESKESKQFETSITKKDGKVIWTQTMLTPILNDEQKITRLVTVDTDISKIKEQEFEILKQGETLTKQRDELASQKEQIEEQNQHISTSIVYAKTIQDTVMPLEVNLTKRVDYFAFLRSVQIVSGDFYWFTNVPEEPNMFFLAAVDCSGHGVPGAFMTMIGTRLLSEIIVEHKNYDPKQILDELAVGLVRSLKQEDGANNDSMEICLCKFEHTSEDTYKMTFSGAKRPVFFYLADSKEFKQFRADRITIGGVMGRINNDKFTNQEVILKAGDLVYMTSDGYANQPNKEGVKFGTSKFEKLLKDIASKEILEQKQILEDTFNQYIEGDTELLDDITVFGVKLLNKELS